MEVLKPLVVLALFGMILYGAYSVVQKGPSSEPVMPAGQEAALPDAPPFAAPEVQVAAPQQPATPPTRLGDQEPVSPAPTIADAPTESGTTYLAAESAPPPSADQLSPRSPIGQPPAQEPTAIAGFDAAPNQPPAAAPPLAPPATLPAEPPGRIADSSGDVVAAPATTIGNGSSAAFSSAWAEAHNMLSAGRYAEALTALSVWYDDPALGLEESQRLEDLLGQLAGTVIYSQQDLLMPPHVVAAGETLPAVALQLGISWQLLGKINGVANPQDLIPGEHLKVIRGPFDAVVSVSRRRLSLQLGGNYAGSFPVAVGRQLLTRVGSSIPVTDVRRGSGRDVQTVASLTGDPAGRPSIVLADGLVIEAAEDPGVASDTSPPTSLVVSVRDLAELLDILGPGSKVLIRQ